MGRLHRWRAAVASVLRPARILAFSLPLLVLAAAGMVSWHLWDRERQDIELQLQAEFETRVRETVGIFRERMLAYEQALHATHGLFATSGRVQRGDFQAFVARLRIDSHPGLQGLGYSVYVPSGQKALHVETVRKQGFPSYSIQPAGERDDVTAAVYFEPSGSSLLSTLGSDYFAEPSRRHAMEAARDTGGIAISNKVKLPQEDAALVQAGYRMYLPVYRPGLPTGTVAERRAAINGWIYAAFSMDGLMSNILGERANIDVEVQDSGVGQGDEQLTDTLGDRVGGESSLKLFMASPRVEVGGYSWTLTARSLPNFASPVAISKLQLVARVGAAASLGLAALAFYLVRRRIRIAQADEALRRAKENAEAASRAKTQFLAVASHDLRQPIQALSLFTATLQAMAKKPGLPGADVAHIATRLQLALNALGRLLNGLFELSGLENGAVTVTNRPVPVAELLHEINAAFAGPAQAKGLDFRVRIPRGLWLDTDRMVLARVLSNLVANAVRYTAAGRILVGCRRRGGQLEIQVLDTGIGIAADQLPKVFGEFYQAPNVVRDREHGMGLGLAIVRRSVELLGGTTQVRSEPGRGSVFSVTLPLATAPVQDAQAGGTPESGPGGTVLVIDDDPQIRESMQRLLQEWGHTVAVAATVDEAVAHARATDIGLVLSDMQLADGVSGIDAVQDVARALGRPVRSVLITGDTTPEALREAQRQGLRLLYKPVEPDALAALVGRHGSAQQ